MGIEMEVWIAAMPLRHAFTISRSTARTAQAVFVRMRHEALEGLGETVPSAFYGHTAESVAAALERLRPWLASADPSAPRALALEAFAQLNGDRAALCALDVALCDLAARRAQAPLWRWLGLRSGPIPPTTYTIGLDSIERMAAKLRERPGWAMYKIKLGRADDLEIVRALRAETAAPFSVDANCAWGPEETIEKSKALRDLGVVFIEQPMRPERLRDMDRVFAESALPLIADENAEKPEHIPALVGRFHGANVKLVKCGGLLPALRMLEMARELGLRTMCGCMTESSLLCTAAAHLGSLLDYADLDGPLLLAEDPCRGMQYDGGRMILPDAPGHGARFVSI